MLYEPVEGLGALGFFGCRTARPDSANSGSEFLFLFLQCTALVADGGSGQGEFFAWLVFRRLEHGLRQPNLLFLGLQQCCSLLLTVLKRSGCFFFQRFMLGPVLLF